MNAIVNIPAKNVLVIAVYSSFLKTVTKMASSLFSVTLGQKRKEIQEVNIPRHPTGAEAMTCGEHLKGSWHNSVLGFKAIPANCLMSPRSMYLPTDHCYPNDKQLYVSFSPKKNTGQTKAVGSIQSCVEDIRKWPTNNNCCLMMIKKNS